MLSNLNLKIGSKLVLISIVCIIPAITIAGIYLHQQVQSLVNTQITASQKNNLFVAADQIQREMLHTKDTATVIATDQVIRRSLDNYTSVGLNGRLNRIAAIYPQLDYVLLLDEDKTVFAVTTINAQKIKIPSEVILGESVVNHPLMPDSKELDTVFGNPSKDPYTKIFNLDSHYSQWFIAPVIIRGEAKGWVVLAYKFQPMITELLEKLVTRLVEQGFPALSSNVMDKQDRIIAGSIIVEGNTLEQKHQLIRELSDLSINIYFDKVAALRPLDNVRNLMFLAFIPLVLALIFGLYLSIRKILINPIKNLEEGAIKFSQGQLDYRIPEIGQDEISQLAHAFNTMGANIEDSKHNLEEQVAQRTWQAEEASNRLQAIVDTAAEAIVTMDTGGLILSFNKAAENIFGYGEAEVVGKPVKMLMPPEVANKHDKYLQNYHDTGIKHIIGSGRELFARKKSGKFFPVYLSVTEVKASYGTIYTGLIRDITLSKEAEWALLQAKEAAENSARYKSEFLASMSHEIRTPMNGILGMLGLLQRSKLDEEQYHRTKLAISSAESLLVIINDILDFSKIEAGKIELETIDFDLGDMLGEFAETIGHRAEEKGLELILDVAQVQHTMVRGDPGRIRQILTNLVGNAIKFTDHGEIIIRAELSEPHEGNHQLCCSIKDTGIGIGPEKLATVFDSFTQVDASTTREYGGTGLGLAIAKQFCELMGGNIAVSSEPNNGSQFDFTVTLQSSEQSQRILPSVNIKGLPILVVDDNATNREVLREQFKQWGAEVTEAVDAKDALALMEQRCRNLDSPTFDVALLDMMMPQMDGAELGEAIRKDTRFNGTKLIMMTSLSHRGDAQYFHDLGFSAYFTKPATTSDLFDALNVVLAGGDILDDAQPLVTRHYLKGLKRSDADDSIDHALPEDCRLLLVEDNRVNQAVALGILEELGLHCDIAENGLEAVNALKQADKNTPYHLVLMDCQMPEMDGYEATRQIRQNAAGEAYVQVPIVAMTANAMKGDKEKCLEAGMSDYLSKPIEPDELVLMLEKWLLTADVSQSPSINTSNSASKSAVESEQTSIVGNDTGSDTEGDIEIWDKAAALNRLGGKVERLNRLVDICDSDISEQLERLRRAVIDGGAEDVRQLAHGIKGVAANLSVLSLQEAAQDMEAAAIDANTEKFSQCMLVMNDAYQAFTVLLAQHRKESPMNSEDIKG